MLRLLVETCGWLDVAKDHRQENTLSVLEELIRLGEVSLIVPTVVLVEFARHKTRIVEESRRSLSTVFKRVKEAVDQLEIPRRKGLFSSTSTKWIISSPSWAKRLHDL